LFLINAILIGRLTASVVPSTPVNLSPSTDPDSTFTDDTSIAPPVSVPITSPVPPFLPGATIMTPPVVHTIEHTFPINNLTKNIVDTLKNGNVSALEDVFQDGIDNTISKMQIIAEKTVNDTWRSNTNLLNQSSVLQVLKQDTLSEFECIQAVGIRKIGEQVAQAKSAVQNYRSLPQNWETMSLDQLRSQIPSELHILQLGLDKEFLVLASHTVNIAKFAAHKMTQYTLNILSGRLAFAPTFCRRSQYLCPFRQDCEVLNSFPYSYRFRPRAPFSYQ